MKKRSISILLSAAMVAGSLAGTAVTAHAEEKEWEYKEGSVSVLIDPDTPSAGYEAVFELMEEKIGLHVDVELRASGTEGETITKTRLASGEMTDICGYNSGSKLGELSPAENFIDISGEEWADRLDDTFKMSVSAGSDAVYGVPVYATQSGCILYNKAKYEEYGLEVPKTWDEFLANCEVLKEAGETAVIDSYGDSWTSQVVYLGDHYNVLAEDPEFPAKFQEGKAKYAESAAGIKSFQKIADMAQYHNDDYTATTYADACEMLVNGDGVHWCILAQALSSIYADYPEEIDNIGLFGIPGDDPENAGLTVWMPTTWYGNANSENREDILRFMEFYISDEALDCYTEQVKPDGPYAIKGYALPEDAYPAIAEDAQAYFDAGKTCLALEFETPVKGANCEQICQEVGTGQVTAEEGAAAYDEDCVKMATQLGLDWE